MADAVAEDTWPAPRGPYCGNAAYGPVLAPPLAPLWQHDITAKHHDGMRVGGRGAVVVPVGGKDLRCLALADGAVRWERRSCRQPERECVLAGDHVWTSEASFSTSSIALATGEVEKLKKTPFQPLGVCRQGKRTVFVLRDGVISLPERSYADHGGERVFGCVSGALLYATSSTVGDDGVRANRGLLCREAITGKARWTVPAAAKAEYPFAVGGDALVGFSFDQRIRVRDAADGAVRWECPTAHLWDTLAPVVIAGGRLFRWEGSDLVCHDLASGKPRWTVKAPDHRTNLLAIGDLLWVGMERKGKAVLAALDQATGKERWAMPMKTPLSGYALALIDDRLVCIVGRKLICYGGAV